MITPYGGPEYLFGLHPLEIVPDGAHVTMPTGPWLTGEDGTPAAGVLGMLLDVGLGQAVVSCCAEGQFSVTTELSIDFCLPVPVDGTLLRSESRLVLQDGAGGFATGAVLDDAERPLAFGTTWHRFSPAVPLPDVDEAPTSSLPQADSLTGLLGVTPDPDGTMTFPHDPLFANPGGVLHGGVLACAAEMSARKAVKNSNLRTGSVRVIYLRPGAGVVTVIPRVRHAGRSLAIVDVEAQREDGRTCATAVVALRAADEPT